jgi:tetratricopeptide (TPR) repeat protein
MKVEEQAMKRELRTTGPGRGNGGVRLVLASALVILWGLGTADGAGRNTYTLANAKASKAEKLLAKEDHAKAEKLFREAIEIEPSLPTAHLGLGAALVGLKRFEEAFEALQMAEEKYVSWDHSLAEAELQQRQEAFRASQEFETFLGTKNPGAATGAQATTGVTRNVANRLESEQHLTVRRWDLEEIQRIPPQVFYLEGVAQLRLGQPEKGIEALRICLALDPSHGLSHYNMAVALFGMGELQEAKTHLDAAVDAGVEPNPRFVADLEQALQ